MVWLSFSTHPLEKVRILPLFRKDLDIDELKVGIGHKLEPPFPASQPDSILNIQIFDGLTKVDGFSETQPNLVDSWQQLDDLSWFFKLKSDVLFSDGSRLSVNDVVFSYQQSLHEKWQNYSFLQEIAAVEPVDELSFKILTKAPDPILDRKLRFFYILSANAYKQKKIVGTGPYKLALFVPNRAELVVNEFYHSTKPKVKKAVIETIEDEKTRADALIGGLINLAEFNSQEEVGRLSSSGLQVIQFLEPSLVYLAVNPVGDLTDSLTRLSIYQIIDPDQLISNIGVSAVPATQLSAEILFHILVKRFSSQIKPEVQGDLSLVSLVANQKIGEEIARQLQTKGIKLMIYPSQGLDKLPASKKQLILVEFKPNFFDPLEFFDQATKFLPNYKNNVVIELIQTASREFDWKKRSVLLEKAARIISDDLVLMPLYSPKKFMVGTQQIFWQPKNFDQFELSQISGKGFVFEGG